jgi:hypothetical protein
MIFMHNVPSWSFVEPHWLLVHPFQLWYLLNLVKNVFNFTVISVKCHINYCYWKVMWEHSLYFMLPVHSHMMTLNITVSITYICINKCKTSSVCHSLYICQLFKKNPAFLVWLRYMMWIPLYPLGFLCEGVVILRFLWYSLGLTHFLYLCIKLYPNQFSYARAVQ